MRAEHATLAGAPMALRSCSGRRWRRVVALLALAGCFALCAAGASTFTFKSGAKFEGEVIEFKGTNSIVVRSSKDAKQYTITISMLSDDDQRQLAELRSQITGAFGVKLGQKFNLSFATALDGGTGYEKRYRFSPAPPLPSFTEYWVKVTPRSNHVWLIVAIARLDVHSKALDEWEKLVISLATKYGPAEQKSEHLLETSTFTKGNREVVLVLDLQHNEATLSLTYRDKTLRTEALKETPASIPGL